MKRWTLGSVLTWATEDFQKRGMERPRLEAEVMLAHVLGLKRLELYLSYDKPLDAAELAKYKEAIIRRRSGAPSSYITGTREFWSLRFFVDERVLIPRPETERLVEAALDRMPSGGRMLDLCTGSGCVAAAVASERPDLIVDATDISEEALEVARENIDLLGLASRVTLAAGDLFAPVGAENRYHVITANAPYVRAGEIPGLTPEVRSEPALALDGGADGLDVVRRIIEQAPPFLEANGWLLLEVDPRQVALLTDDIGPRFFDSGAVVLQDLGGRDRVVGWKKGDGGTQ